MGSGKRQHGQLAACAAWLVVFLVLAPVLAEDDPVDVCPANSLHKVGKQAALPLLLHSS